MEGGMEGGREGGMEHLLGAPQVIGGQEEVQV